MLMGAYSNARLKSEIQLETLPHPDRRWIMSKESLPSVQWLSKSLIWNRKFRGILDFTKISPVISYIRED